MKSSMKKSARAATAAIVVAILAAAMPDDAGAHARKHSRLLAPPPPSWGYFGSIPVTYDYAQAQATSFHRPYYTHFMSDYCDYRNCVVRWRRGAWVPFWYGPID